MECILKKIILLGLVKKIIVFCLSLDFFIKKKVVEFWDFCLVFFGFNVKFGKKWEMGGLDFLF